MYNTVKLHQDHWTLQRYLWNEELDPTKIPKEKVIKTLIYGIKSSGNQSEFALRRIAEMNSQEYPEVNQIIQKDVYVDDCITGTDTKEEAYKRADELQIVTSKGAFNLKGITISGENPPSHLTEDGISVGVGGMKWFSKSDELSLSIPDLNFAPKRRGKKSSNSTNLIPDVLTRRHCLSKVGEIFDITGKIVPLIAAMKIDLRELTDRQLSWDDAIPEELRPVWLSHFEMMSEINHLRFKRLVVPEDAVSLDVETLDFGDSSQTTICVGIYARFLRKDGTFSCQLVFARSRMVPKDLTLPRAELMASLINAHTGEIVRRSFKSFFKSSTKFTDSQISLHWISNDQKTLKQWVRSRVIEIHRFTTKDQWYHIRSKQMVVDVGIRRGATIHDVKPESPWINGQPWMHLPKSEFPAKRVEEITLEQSELSEIKKELSVNQFEVHLSTTEWLDEFKKRYKFSGYIIDPNQHCFQKVIRILTFVMKFINQTRKSKHSSKPPSQDLMKDAESYFFRKGTIEVKHFLKPQQYQKIPREKDGILVYTGRILPEQEVSIVGQFTTVMKDLTRSSFCVPILEKNSPVAFSIVMDVHWNHPTVKHSGIETTHRFVLMKAYIIEGRQLVKQVRESCERCRYLMKRTVNIAMGPVSVSNLTIAPAFFHSQIDLSGPHMSYSPQHKRTTVKIWLVVFCCCSTSAVSIKLMDDYSTPAFMLAFTRFACDHGFPAKLLCDEGTQLVKGCKDMRLDIRDLKSQLMTNRKIDFNFHGKVERKIKEINLSTFR
ncbi:uncharacterized protein [Clytia hemisphaerica]|uniref:uncharacterized protein n=1 Tax=Clytia hemisphaerica TaxID=252671 RepID=UPI0034D5E73E